MIDENISDADKHTLQSAAENSLNLLQQLNDMTRGVAENTMLDIASLYLGDNDKQTGLGMPIADIMDMTTEDSSMFDYLYSASRMSNPLVALIGTTIREAQDTRSKIQNEFALRIRRAEDALRKSGYPNTEFMYGNDGRIVSDIQWDAYYKARGKYIGYLKRQGLRGFDLQDAIEYWEENNTEDRVVDTKSGRTERVPNASFQDHGDFMDGWTQGQIDYYNTVMQIKGELGTMLPSIAQKQYHPVQVRKTVMDVIKAAFKGQLSGKQTARLILDKMRPLKIQIDDTQYASNGVALEGSMYDIARGDYDGTPKKRIPVFFMRDLEHPEDMMVDFGGSLHKLAQTAVNYDTMNTIKSLVELMADYLEQQHPTAKSIKNFMVDVVDDVIDGKVVQVAQVLKKRALAANTIKVVEGMISMHIYGEKTVDKSLMARLAQALIRYTSFKNLTVNMPGAVANELMGECSMLIDAGAGEFYNVKDYLWAHGMLFKNKTLDAPGAIMDLLTNDKNSMARLLEEKFDPLNDISEKQGDVRYHHTLFGKMFGDFNTMALYGGGEAIIHFVNMYAILHNQRVYHDGKLVPLYEAFRRINKSDGNYELGVKDGYYQLSGKQIDEEFLDDIRKKIRYANQTTHGAMNDEDRGVFSQRILGKLVLNFRQWMIEHYSRRYRRLHYDPSAGGLNQTDFYLKKKVRLNGKKVRLWDALDRLPNPDGTFDLSPKAGVTRLDGTVLDIDALQNWMTQEGLATSWREGFWSTAGSLAQTWLHQYLKFINDANVHWDDLTTSQKYNIKRVAAEMTLLASLFTLSFAIGDPDRHKNKFWARFWLYQNKRLLFDEFAAVPVGRVLEAKKMMQAPMASITTATALFYPIVGLAHGDQNKTVQRGRHKGENMFVHNLLKYDVPFYNQWDRLLHLSIEDDMYTVFDNLGKPGH